MLGSGAVITTWSLGLQAIRRFGDFSNRILSPVASSSVPGVIPEVRTYGVAIAHLAPLWVHCRTTCARSPDALDADGVRLPFAIG